MCCTLKKIFLKLFRYIWTLFLNGLLTILPIILTLAIFNITYKLLKSWLEPLKDIMPPFLTTIPHAEIIIAVAFIFLVGTILKIFILKRIIHSIESIIERLPLIRTVYSGIKQLTQALTTQEEPSFKKVVLIEFPRKGVYSLGFLISQMNPEIAPNKETKFFNIFIPTTPNPTNGYFTILPEHELKIIKMSRKDAMAMIISGGIIQPTTQSENGE